jgi:hypothetical protein
VTSPIVSADDLALFLSDDQLNAPRADLMIKLAQQLCESVVTPLPDGAEVVVTRMAARGYVSATSTRGAQLVAAGSPFGLVPGGVGGVFLTRQDKGDLRRMAGGGGAFTINPLAADYSVVLPPWDTNNTDAFWIETS